MIHLFVIVWSYAVGAAWSMAWYRISRNTESLDASRLGKWNFYLLQWFWFRVTREYEDRECFEIGWKAQQTGWGILFVAPMSGWGCDYWPKSKSHHICNVKPKHK